MKLLITTQVVDTEDPLLGFFHEWICTFAKDFDRIDVICLRKGQVALPSTVHVHSLGKEEGESRVKYLIRFYTYFAKLFLGQRYNYVFFHMGALYNVLALPFFLIRYFFGTKFYWWKAHGHINMLGKIALLCVDAVYTPSPQSFPITTRKRRVVGHAISPLFTQDFSRMYVPPTLRIGCVGRISRVKRQDVVIEVACSLRELQIPFSITCVGPVVDQIFYDELEEMIRSNHLESEVIFVGAKNQREIQSLMQNFDILIHPSETGSIDKVVLEAMGMGVIPIACTLAYGDLLTTHGLTVTSDSPDAYMEVIQNIRDLKPADYQKLTHTLRAQVVAEHSLQTLSQRIFGTS